MTGSTGLVIPAYDPDPGRVTSYVESVQRVLDPEEVRIELDAPSLTDVDAIAGLDATVNVADTRRGKGAAITHGFEQLSTDVLAFADADGSTPPESLAAVLRGLERGDVSVGSRRHPDAEIVANQSRLRETLGDCFAYGARVALDVDVHDFQCGAKAMTDEAWTRLSDDVSEPGFAWDIEVIGMAHAHGLEVVEVPITWVDKPGSTVDPFETALELGRTLLAVRYRMRSVSERSARGLLSRVGRHVDQ
jgi:glycosyltransferase involved in cell wall biosynthesis